MKRLIAGVGGTLALLIFICFLMLWVSGLEMVTSLVRGVPFYWGKEGHQIHVSHLVVLFLLVVCPLGFGIVSAWWLRIAFRRNKT